MKKFLIILSVLFVATSCSFDTDDVDTSGYMYEDYKISDDVLKSANLPIVHVYTENNTKILDKDNWINATFSISNKDEWNMDETEITIKGRGNSTWNQPKRPYAIKFSKKQSVCGMPKGKRWVLIANYMDNSFMKNYMAFYMARKIGMDYTVRGEFVNLVFNGNYVGLYWLGEAIKVDKNRVDIDEENEYLIEMDKSYDETWRFHSEYKKLPYMVKNDDFMTSEKFEYLKNHVAEMESVLYNESSTLADIEKYVDLNSFAQFYVVNEIMANKELKNPKSCYFTLKSDNILRASTVWDFDWAGYNPSHNFLDKTIYYDSLFEYSEFRNDVNMYVSMLSSEDFVNEINAVKSYIEKSAKLDKERWGVHYNPVGERRNSFDEYVEYFKYCITDRLNYLKNNSF